jgi:pterin-4a-carbinolamine dehydratase
MARSIFISYRREDSGSDAIAISNAIRNTLGRDIVFLDTASHQPGEVWPNELRDTLNSAATVMVLIGPGWLSAGTDQLARRRIDEETDWVRQELTLALEDERKRVLAVLVKGGKVPPPQALPEAIRALTTRQAIPIRNESWDHDIKLLLAQLSSASQQSREGTDSHGLYPINPPEGPEPVDEGKLQRTLDTVLPKWKKIKSPLPEKPTEIRIELFREYRFRSFQDAILFMSQVAPGCDIAMHHPRWENIWKTIRVYLTTWDIGHRVSDRDVQLASYFDRAYRDFEGTAQSSKQAQILPTKSDAKTSFAQRTGVFISYSHKDKKWLTELQIMLRPLLRDGVIGVWDDTKIRPGAIWKQEIERALASAKVAVLLVSANFLASDFIAKNELPPLLSAAQKEGATIFWVYISSCLYEQTEIEKYQAAHDVLRPLDRITKANRQAILREMCARIRELVG